VVRAPAAGAGGAEEIQARMDEKLATEIGTSIAHRLLAHVR